jgi:hypothetical protein
MLNKVYQYKCNDALVFIPAFIAGMRRNDDGL